jgi:hypothetical protein
LRADDECRLCPLLAMDSCDAYCGVGSVLTQLVRAETQWHWRGREGEANGWEVLCGDPRFDEMTDAERDDLEACGRPHATIEPDQNITDVRLAFWEAALRLIGRWPNYSPLPGTRSEHMAAANAQVGHTVPAVLKPTYDVETRACARAYLRPEVRSGRQIEAAYSQESALAFMEHIRAQGGRRPDTVAVPRGHSMLWGVDGV